jgi:phospholipase/carboxylesterase
MIAAAGSLAIDEAPEVETGTGVGSSGTLPLLAHGDLRIAQSFAIEQYVASIAPNFAGLDSAQRAIDSMFCKIKEDMFQGFVKVLDGISADASKNASAGEDVAAVGDKWFPVVEGRLPENGFINALDFPTAADLAVVNIAKAFMPFGAAYRIGGYDVSAKFPRFAAHVARVSEYSTVKCYLDFSTTMSADPDAVKATPSTDVKVEAGRISKLATETASLWQDVDCPVPDCAVVWLHGIGETEIFWQELFEMNDLLPGSERPPEGLGECRWIMPRATMAPCTARRGALTYQWFDTPEFPVCLIIPAVPNRSRKEEDPKDIYNAVHRVHEAVLALEVEGVLAERIAIAGFGQGGALAVHAATSYPKALAGCAMLSGYVPCAAALREAATPEGKQLRLLWLHGIHDAVVQTDAATAQAKELLELGVRLDFRLSFDYGHETTDDELKAFRAWIIQALSPPKLDPDASDEQTEALHVHVDLETPEQMKLHDIQQASRASSRTAVAH